MKARLFLSACALLLASGACAAADEDLRAQIAAERRVIEDRYATEQHACRERFAVTACLDESRARRRSELAPLRERELRLDDAQRQARAQERRAAVAAKQAAAASQVSASHTAASQPAAARPARSPASASAHTERIVRHRDNGAAQAAEAADRARAAERRREAARQTQDRVARRLAERAAQGRKAEPLPVPGAAASAAR